MDRDKQIFFFFFLKKGIHTNENWDYRHKGILVNGNVHLPVYYQRVFRTCIFWCQISNRSSQPCLKRVLAIGSIGSILNQTEEVVDVAVDLVDVDDVTIWIFFLIASGRAL